MQFIRLNDLFAQRKLQGKRVFIRANLNVPQDDAGNITEDTRIRASVPAIRQALDAGAAVMVTSHLGRPTEGEFKPEDSLAPVAKRLTELLGMPVELKQNWIDGVDVNPGQVVLLENCRVNKGEKKNSDELAQKMAHLCDVYVNDAFGTAHRAEATTQGIAKFAPLACAGPLLAAELDALGKALHQPARPLVAIVAGSKVSTKLTILKTLADKVDNLIVGGGIANTFMLAAGLKIGKSLAEPELVDDAKAIIDMMIVRGASVLILVDVVCAKEFSPQAKATVKDVRDVADDDMILDIGPKTAAQLAEQLVKAGTIVWNGPVGVFEFDQFGEGTKKLAQAIAGSKAFSIAGGGDTLAAIAKYGIADKVGYISTGGGAFLEFLEGKTLPAVEILLQRAKLSGKTENDGAGASASGAENDRKVMQRSTKIVATIGPASSDAETLTRMIQAGVDVVRLNFSHGKAQDHIDRANLVRQVAADCGREVAIMADLQGPKIRVGKFENGKVQLQKGAKFILDAACELGNQDRVGLDYKELPRELKVGDVLLLNDGMIVLVVDKVVGSAIHTTVKIGGELSNNKGINRQGGGLSASALTAKDMEDIKTAMAFQADYVAVSFPKSGADMMMARQLAYVASEPYGHKPLMIAKIERAEAIPALQEILDASDAIMVARGDLAVEVGNAAVPALQKRMIQMARESNKLTITATQMMESMIVNAIPTRAEVSDVANAVLDGTDAVMTSAETASGFYPAETVEAMAASCLEAEKSQHCRLDADFLNVTFTRIDQSIAYGALFTAYHLRAKAIVALTESGSTALWMSRHNIDIPIYAMTPSIATQRKATLYRNVCTLKLEHSSDREPVMKAAQDLLLAKGSVKKGDMIVITWGEPMGQVGGTNALKIMKIGEY